ncbi:hypothetical protein [Peribacillus loiseleuriae]|uniref:Uncharacterized protein n=1 Tax=Peribacillus loiseleuriae TaxID=1679170 RepID=A0A0K9GXD6_9BACI|nr:hypothetical protein [Peribacillus loiseleuriae]KMY50922.1 hypothetical protein AC625_16470 [Peribacillus loiseleuriae]
MNTSPKLHFFSYKGAFLFFSFVLIFNLLFTPLLQIIGVDKYMALYIGNTFVISVGLTAVLVFIEGKCKGIKQILTLFFSLLIFCAMVCYLIVYR